MERCLNGATGKSRFERLPKPPALPGDTYFIARQSLKEAGFNEGHFQMPADVVGTGGQN